jgi:IS1 family transposase
LASLPTSTTINTSFVERDNLSLRHHNRRLTRDTLGFSKARTWLEKQLWLALAYYHYQRGAAARHAAGARSRRRWPPG